MTDKEFKNIAPNLYHLKNKGSGFSVPNNYFELFETTVSFDIFNPKGKQGFNTPENYFESVEVDVYNKIQEKELSFSIPEGYFDSIEDTIIEKIHNQPKVINLKSRVIKQLIPIVAAASLLLFISLRFFNPNDSSNDLFTSLEASEIENWIENDNLGLSTYEIASIYEDIDIENLDVNSLYDDDEILKYFNDIDIESLILTN